MASRCGHCSGLLRLERGEYGDYLVCFNCGREHMLPAGRYGKLGQPNPPANVPGPALPIPGRGNALR